MIDIIRSSHWFIKCFIYIALLSFFSCIQQIEPKLTGKSSEIILVNSFLYADSIPMVWLKIGKNELGNDWENITDAQVSLLKINPENGITEENISMYFSDSLYISSNILSAGFTYRLSVETSDGKIVSASTNIPKPIKIDTLLRSEGPSMQFEFVEGNVNLDRVTFRPRKGDVSYFETKFFFRSGIRISLDQWSEQKYIFFSKSYTREDLILKENLPDQFMYAFPFSVDPKTHPEVSLVFYRGSQYFVLETTSEEYYNYKKSLYSHLDAISYQVIERSSDLFNPSIFKAPLPLYSNIEGGRGVFAGLSRDIYKIY